MQSGLIRDGEYSPVHVSVRPARGVLKAGGAIATATGLTRGVQPHAGPGAWSNLPPRCYRKRLQDFGVMAIEEGRRAVSTIAPVWAILPGDAAITRVVPRDFCEKTGRCELAPLLQAAG